jgi:hypothetical protein
MIPDSFWYRPLNVPRIEVLKFQQDKGVIVTEVVRFPTSRLLDNAADGSNRIYTVVPPMVEYSLTPMGRLFI